MEQNTYNSWIDARFVCEDSGQARRLARAMRKAGAAHVMIKQASVWILLADNPKNRDIVQDTAANHCLESMEQGSWADPLYAWAEPASTPLGPGLSLASADSGIRPGPDTLIIDPLTAFGSGDHPSTWLNLALLALILNGDFGTPPQPVQWAADIGAGTGVLALAIALKSGAKVFAVDPDPAARRACGRNQALNPLAGDLVSFVQGTHECVSGQFGLIAANLPGPLLVALATDLASVMAPGGKLVTSGFRIEAEQDIINAFAKVSLKPVHHLQRLGWSGIIFTTV